MNVPDSLWMIIKVNVRDSGSTPGVHITSHYIFCVGRVQPKARKNSLSLEQEADLEVPSHVSMDTGGHGPKGPRLYPRQAYSNQRFGFNVQLLAQLILCSCIFGSLTGC